jgi:hypothetical protein
MKNNSTNENVAEEFYKEVAQYTESVEKEIKVWADSYWDDESVFILISDRDYIHNLFESAQKENIQLDIKKLQETDKTWQEWLIKNKQPGFAYNLKTEEPKQKWWWWADRLDELSESEKATI